MFVLINLMVVIGVLNAIKMYKVNYLKPKKKGYAKHTASFMKIEDAIFWEPESSGHSNNCPLEVDNMLNCVILIK
jgi:hypothetical protein